MRVFASLVYILLALGSACADYADNAASAINTSKEKFYNIDTGLWNDLWWQSGNFIETIARFGQLDSGFKQTSAMDIISNTYAKSGNQKGANRWVNMFYDDMGWWALGWIASYDLTGDTKYLDTARDLFEDMTSGWNTSCNGGIWWSKEREYVSAISNELFLSVTAHLANRVSGTEKANYTTWARREWDWFWNAGIINSDNLINDGLDTYCKNNGSPTYTYNQGVILAGLSELARATGDGALVSHANDIAHAAMSKLTDNGILTETGGVDLDVQGALFKGAFVRGLSTLNQYERKQDFTDFLRKNADSAWAQPKVDGLIVGRWQGGSEVANAGSQGAGIDVLVAAAQANNFTGLLIGSMWCWPFVHVEQGNARLKRCLLSHCGRNTTLPTGTSRSHTAVFAATNWSPSQNVVGATDYSSCCDTGDTWNRGRPYWLPLFQPTPYAMARIREQNKKIEEVLATVADQAAQIDQIAKIRGWHRPRDDSAYFPLVQDLMNEKISIDDACVRIFGPIDEKIAASKLDEVNFLDLWYSIIHSAKRIDFSGIEQRDQLADLVDFVGKFKNHSIPDNDKYDYIYNSLTDFDLASREAYNDAPVAQNGFLAIEIAVWANLNHFFARITDQGIHDFSMYAIWAMRQALENDLQDDGEATAAQKYAAYVPAASAWIIGAGRTMFIKEADLTPTDQKQGNPARGGELWKGKAEFSKKRWALWKERLVTISTMEKVTENTRSVAKTSVEQMERSETFELV
ncbi:glycoside hydrolase family 76 protein [Plenodomus tracheiphilus IPT5]|uniref:Glycoside hydrolase family 76 protein n=1 Tax=Plenodomus tracheiphilus IPT5 TaxID=1408161 RepID=A0A6A7B6Y3_9PLEO|nr:glycoside hydrolase family 76 protein [Plenodomus tracheiphilus IPT5]